MMRRPVPPASLLVPCPTLLRLLGRVQFCPLADMHGSGEILPVAKQPASCMQGPGLHIDLIRTLLLESR